MVMIFTKYSFCASISARHFRSETRFFFVEEKKLYFILFFVYIILDSFKKKDNEQNFQIKISEKKIVKKVINDSNF